MIIVTRTVKEPLVLPVPGILYHTLFRFSRQRIKMIEYHGQGIPQ